MFYGIDFATNEIVEFASPLGLSTWLSANFRRYEITAERAGK